MDTFLILIYAWMGLALFLFPLQLWITAPYGRHTPQHRKGMMDNKLGWFVMEIVSPAVFGYFFLSGTNDITMPMWVFFGLWVGHYVNRSIIYPTRTRTSGKKIPVLIVFSAIFFNLINGWINGYWLGTFGDVYPDDWIYSPQMVCGLVMFLSGAYINVSSDNYLIGLRSGDDQGYKMPEGRFFDRISCPNHFGEILEWAGFAIMCWNPAAFSFALWTAGNLIPRAISHHKWYKGYFREYPSQRKAVIPYVI